MLRQIFKENIFLVVLGFVAVIGCDKKDSFALMFSDLYKEVCVNGSLRVDAEPYYRVYEIPGNYKAELLDRKNLLPEFSQLKRMEGGCTLIGESERNCYSISGRRAEVYRATKCNDGCVVAEIFIDSTNNKLVFSCPHTYW